MNLDIETSVRDPNGEEIGRISAVVLGPDGHQVENIVLRTGGLLGRELLLPVAMLSSAPGDVVQFDGGNEVLDSLPEYRQAEYAVGPDDPLAGFAGTALFPFNEMTPMLPVVEMENVAEGSTVITQGTAVICSDLRAGVVDEVEVDETGAISALICRPDSENQPDFRIPFTLVHRIEADAVRLNCTLAQLPDYVEYLYAESEEPEARDLI